MPASSATSSPLASPRRRNCIPIQAAAEAAGGLSPEVVRPLWEKYGIGVSES